MFLMPSSFEPCGISQMLAMRAGQPCVAHAVGGLRDTIADDVTGFLFDGNTQAEKARNFVTACERAMQLKTEASSAWVDMRRAAAAKRFDWSQSAQQYQELLYADAGH